MGMPRLRRGGRGDLIAHIDVVVPKQPHRPPARAVRRARGLDGRGGRRQAPHPLAAHQGRAVVMAAGEVLRPSASDAGRPRVCVVNLGCKVNRVESDWMEALVRGRRRRARARRRGRHRCRQHLRRDGGGRGQDPQGRAPRRRPAPTAARRRDRLRGQPLSRRARRAGRKRPGPAGQGDPGRRRARGMVQAGSPRLRNPRFCGPRGFCIPFGHPRRKPFRPAPRPHAGGGGRRRARRKPAARGASRRLSVPPRREGPGRLRQPLHLLHRVEGARPGALDAARRHRAPRCHRSSPRGPTRLCSRASTWGVSAASTRRVPRSTSAGWSSASVPWARTWYASRASSRPT